MSDDRLFDVSVTKVAHLAFQAIILGFTYHFETLLRLPPDFEKLLDFEIPKTAHILIILYRGALGSSWNPSVCFNSPVILSADDFLWTNISAVTPWTIEHWRYLSAQDIDVFSFALAQGPELRPELVGKIGADLSRTHQLLLIENRCLAQSGEPPDLFNEAWMDDLYPGDKEVQAGYVFSRSATPMETFSSLDQGLIGRFPAYIGIDGLSPPGSPRSEAASEIMISAPIGEGPRDPDRTPVRKRQRDEDEDEEEEEERRRPLKQARYGFWRSVEVL